MTDPLLAKAAATRFITFDVGLQPVGSPTLHLTTFANTGPSFYVDRLGRPSAVVDSVASMANQLEGAVWDAEQERPVEAVAALPWVDVRDPSGARYTCSRLAAHRLNAHAVMAGIDENGETFESVLSAQMNGITPPVGPKLASIAATYDPVALLHGVWWAGLLGGRARLARVVSARLDAHDVVSQAVQVGGQKTADHPLEVGVKQVKDDAKTVLGEVPAYLSEISAQEVTGRILVDVRSLRAHRLPPELHEALVGVALLEAAELIDAWPHWRSRCALDVVDPELARTSTRGEVTLPTASELTPVVADACRRAFPDAAGPTVLTYKPKAKQADAS